MYICEREVRRAMTMDLFKEREHAISEAKRLLGERGMRLRLILGIIACAFSAVSVLILVSSFGFLVDFDALYKISPDLAVGAEIALIALQDILGLLLSLPVFLGFLRGGLAMRNGRPFEFADLFYFFDSPASYARGMGILLRLAWRAFPLVILRIFSLAAVFLPLDDFYFLMILLEVVLIFLGIYTTGKSFPFLIVALLDDRIPLSESMRRAKAATARKMRSIFVFRMRFALLFLLSLLSVGVITLLHVLPCWILATQEYAMILSENDSDSTLSI